MDKQTTRAFAAGLFTASLSLLFYSQTTSMSEMTDKKIIEKLEKKDYVVLSTEEYNKQAEQINQLQKKTEHFSKASKETEETTVNSKENNEQYYTLRITPGMASSEIGETLEKAGMIKSAEEFNNFLTKNDYAKRIQVGEHKIYSSMTMKQIAIVLTTK